MNAFVFSGTSGLYGSSRLAILTAQALRKRGWDSTFGLEPGPLCDLLRNDQFSLSEVRAKRWVGTEGGKIRGWRRFRHNLKIARDSSESLKKLAFEVVHSHSIVSPVGAMIAEQMGLPHVWQMHEVVDTHPERRFFGGLDQAQQFINRSTDIVIANSRFTLEGTSKYCDREKIRIVYLGVVDDATRASSPQSHRQIPKTGPIRLLMVGNVHPQKGQEEAILAVGHLHRKGVSVDLTVVGDGHSEYVESLRRLAGLSGVSEMIHWAGFQNEPAPFYQEADIVLSCSKLEAFGLVTVEAQHQGVPVIGTCSGATPEIIEDGKTGLLYSPGDPGELATRIELLGRSPELVGRLVESAYSAVFERFTIQRYAREVEECYLEAISKHGT